MIKLLKTIKASVEKIFFYLTNFMVLKKSRVLFKSFKINGVIKISNVGHINIGDNFSANSGKNKNAIGGDTTLRLVVFKKEGVITIGDNVGISNSTLVCWDKIEIGNNVLIGGSCKIWDTNFHSLDKEVRMGTDIFKDVKTAPIHIMDNAFIGANCIILKGVTIGLNSIIAAGSIVNKSIPANVIAGGNPCIVIKEIAG